jgi:hypothetical protein
VAGGQQQGESAADAEADDTNLAGAPVLAGQPGADRFHVLVRPALPVAQVTAEGEQAAHGATGVKQIGRDGEVSVAGEPVGLVTQVPAHAVGVVDHDHPGRGA